MILDGHFAVRIATTLGDTVTLRVLGPNDYFGELAVIAPSARHGTVVALDDAVTLSLHRDDFTDLRATVPTIDVVLTTALAEEVRRLSSLLVDALYSSADERVWHRLRDVIDLYRRDNAPIVIPLTQDDLAQLAGTTRPTVNRVLRSGVDDGIVALSRANRDSRLRRGRATRLTNNRFLACASRYVDVSKSLGGGAGPTCWVGDDFRRIVAAAGSAENRRLRVCTARTQPGFPTICGQTTTAIGQSHRDTAEPVQRDGLEVLGCLDPSHVLAQNVGRRLEREERGECVGDVDLTFGRARLDSRGAGHLASPPSGHPADRIGPRQHRTDVDADARSSGRRAARAAPCRVRR